MPAYMSQADPVCSPDPVKALSCLPCFIDRSLSLELQAGGEETPTEHTHTSLISLALYLPSFPFALIRNCSQEARG